MTPMPSMTPEPTPEPRPTRQAWVYASDPVTDRGQLTQVTLPETSSAAGGLTNGSVAVTNCLNEEGGPTSTQEFGGFSFTIAFCHEVATATPDADGNYLELRPPADDSDPNDAFAEVSMYHHVNVIHDFFHDRHGHRALDYPLPALVNVQLKLDPPLGMTGPDGWSPFPNAAFFPKDSWNQLAAQFGLPPRDQDAIIFGQADADFSYDSRVIYHEYTHAMIGQDRLNARVVDDYGVHDLPGAMNEGLADYFAATQGEDPAIGKYGIGKSSPAQVRDLSQARRCPDDLVNEVHADGKVLGSALWALRGAVGSTVADGLTYRAVQQFTASTSLEEAGAILLAEAAAAGVAEIAQPILESHGVIGCERVKRWVAFDAATSAEGLPYNIEGTQSVGVPGFSGWAPGPFGFSADVSADARSLRLGWTVSAGGGGFGGGGGAPPVLALALRKGEPVTLQLGPRITRREDALLRPSAASGVQSVVLGASCLPPGGGRLYFMFVNEGASAASITRMSIEVDPAAEPNVMPVECP